MDGLPFELLLKIFQNVGLVDLLYVIPAVCPGWRNIVQDHLWNKVTSLTCKRSYHKPEVDRSISYHFGSGEILDNSRKKHGKISDHEVNPFTVRWIQNCIELLRTKLFTVTKTLNAMTVARRNTASFQTTKYSNLVNYRVRIEFRRHLGQNFLRFRRIRIGWQWQESARQNFKWWGTVESA